MDNGINARSTISHHPRPRTLLHMLVRRVRTTARRLCPSWEDWQAAVEPLPTESGSWTGTQSLREQSLRW
jgi:hypothetical protein